MLTFTQRATIDEIVALFETGRPVSPEAYTTATVLADGAGITYGIHQATRSVLEAILAEYSVRAGAYAGEIARAFAGHAVADARPYSSEAAAPAWVRDVLTQLRLAGRDTTMQAVQREVFAAKVWDPVEALCRSLGLVEPLSYLTLYDTAIQSGIGRIEALRPNFPEAPPSRRGRERIWTAQFIGARRRWLETYSSVVPGKTELVRRSVYRVVELERMAGAGLWALARPLTVRGVAIR
jgi:hypothetical protein